jgi:hypothetical protein
MAAPIQKSAAKTRAAFQVVTANRLDDGVVVYLDPAGGWTERIDDAQVVEGDAALAAAVAEAKRAEARRVVLESYPIDVAREDDFVLPLRLREKIRAAGPTVRPDVGRALGA